jgi:hypothetical protein
MAISHLPIAIVLGNGADRVTIWFDHNIRLVALVYLKQQLRVGERPSSQHVDAISRVAKFSSMLFFNLGSMDSDDSTKRLPVEQMSGTLMALWAAGFVIESVDRSDGLANAA